jgi:hypothetical protein
MSLRSLSAAREKASLCCVTIILFVLKVIFADFAGTVLANVTAGS